jgi:hypothetical protein
MSLVAIRVEQFRIAYVFPAPAVGYHSRTFLGERLMILHLAIAATLSTAIASAPPPGRSAPPAPANAPPPAPPGSPAGIVDGQIAAYNSGDVETFAAFYADDVEFFDLGPGNPTTMRGKDALIKQYKPMLEKRHPRARLVSRMVDGRFVVDKEQIVAGDNNNSGVAIYEIVDGKIARVWFTPAVLRLRPK